MPGAPDIGCGFLYASKGVRPEGSNWKHNILLIPSFQKTTHYLRLEMGGGQCQPKKRRPNTLRFFGASPLTHWPDLSPSRPNEESTFASGYPEQATPQINPLKRLKLLGDQQPRNKFGFSFAARALSILNEFPQMVAFRPWGKTRKRLRLRSHPYRAKTHVLSLIYSGHAV